MFSWNRWDSFVSIIRQTPPPRLAPPLLHPSSQDLSRRFPPRSRVTSVPFWLKPRRGVHRAMSAVYLAAGAPAPVPEEQISPALQVHLVPGCGRGLFTDESLGPGECFLCEREAEPGRVAALAGGGSTGPAASFGVEPPAQVGSSQDLGPTHGMAKLSVRPLLGTSARTLECCGTAGEGLFPIAALIDLVWKSLAEKSKIPQPMDSWGARKERKVVVYVIYDTLYIA